MKGGVENATLKIQILVIILVCLIVINLSSSVLDEGNEISYTLHSTVLVCVETSKFELDNQMSSKKRHKIIHAWGQKNEQSIFSKLEQ